jgi:hypothetical protein
MLEKEHKNCLNIAKIKLENGGFVCSCFKQDFVFLAIPRCKKYKIDLLSFI